MTHLICINITISSLLVTTASSTMHSVIWLILSFINTALLFILLEIEFIATLILIVYVGAIAILFLFTIMILNLNNQHYTQNNSHLLPTSSILTLTLLIQLTSLQNINSNDGSNNIQHSINIWHNDNIETISTLIYTNYSPWLLLSSGVLLVSMISAITIITNEGESSINQQLFTQIQRNTTSINNPNWQNIQNFDQSSTPPQQEYS